MQADRGPIPHMVQLLMRLKQYTQRCPHLFPSHLSQMNPKFQLQMSPKLQMNPKLQL
ncbi:UNVERIFIED_CONTAM: hypothetical protein Sradi_2997500 [Sesamum radiatum]|uniref:Uncharacterized protein n=1 Tax=Sesamum radiatum TaxID=300843 RepID=A0AAW2S1P4_SESRA